MEIENKEVKSAQCGCPRGLLRCHHMAAALIWIEKNVSRTGVECQWSKSKADETAEQSIDAARSVEMWPNSSSAGAGREVDYDDKLFLFGRLSSLNRFTGQWWIMSPELPSVITDTDKYMFDNIVACQEFITSTDKLTYLLDGMSVPAAVRPVVKELTVGQRNNPVWQQFRKMRVTASNFGLVLRSIGRNQYNQSLFTTLMGGYSLATASAASVQWGIDHEMTALSDYSQKTGNPVQQAGLYLCEKGWLGASPDGIVSESHIIEVKCPWSLRAGQSVFEAAMYRKDFYLTVDDQCNLHLKRNHTYYHQIQGTLHITGANICDLYVWTPTDSEIVRIEKDPGWLINLSKLELFFKDVFIPYVIN